MKLVVTDIDTNMILPKDEYYIKYKDVCFKYISSPRSTDTLLALAKNDEEKKHVYKMASEFIRAFAFINNSDVKLTRPFEVGAGGTYRDLPKFKNKSQNHKTLPKNMGMTGDFLQISYIDTEEKANLLRLYTDARSNDSVYFKILFYWHTIVYPSTNDWDGAKYINQYIESNPLEQYHSNILSKSPFGTFDGDLGKFIKDNIRHSIAHICRTGNSVSLSLDCVEQEESLFIVSHILGQVARYKLENDYNLLINTPGSVCSYFNPDTFKTHYELDL